MSADASDAAARRTWRSLRTLVLERHDRRADVSARLGMGFIRIKALGLLARAPLSLRDLAAGLAVDPPYATVVVDDLEARGLVERRPDPRDRRRKFVELTAAGQRTAAEARDLLDTPPAGFANLSAADLAELERILRVLADEPVEEPRI